MRNRVDHTTFRPVLSEYLEAMRKGGGSPDDYFSVAQEELLRRLTLDSRDPILAAKRAVVQLEMLPDVQATARIEDGYSLRSDGRNRAMFIDLSTPVPGSGTPANRLGTGRMKINVS